MAEYFVRPDGDDSKPGRSIIDAWRTAGKVGASSFLPNDKIRFSCDGIWRGGFILPDSGVPDSPITFTYYGDGELPIFLGSVSKNNATDWISETGNLWYCNLAKDVGHIAVGDNIIPTILAIKRNTKAGCVNQGDFYSDLAGGRLYLYSSGNPATFYDTYLECATGQSSGGSVIGGSQNHIIIEGLGIRHAGAHGMQFNNCNHLIIRYCPISYVGGAYLSPDVRYGNGIEIWDGGNYINVDNNKISLCFDEGATSQGNASVSRTNQAFRYNAIDKCGRGIAFSTNAGNPTVNNIYIEKNEITNSGLGWAIPAISNGQGLGILVNCPQATIAYLRENKIINTAGGGDPNGQGITQYGGAWEISKNYLENVHNAAIRILSSGGGFIAKIHQNIVNGTNGKPAVFLSHPGATHAEIYRNTFYAPSVDIVMQVGANGGYEVNDVDIKNNITHIANAGNRVFYVSDQSTNVRADYNCYFGTNANRSIYWKGINYSITTGWAAYKAASGQDAHSILDDPRFIAIGSDFHLRADSPCIGNGENGTDIGAYEYTGDTMATHSIDVILRVLELADFAMGATPVDLSVQRTKTGTYSVTATAIGGFALPITLSVSGLPTGATFSFNKNPIVPGETSIFSVTPAANTPLGNFTLSFTGNG